jgi:uncharacterized protein (DUF2267 family)
VFYEGWRPAAARETYRNREAFLRRIGERALVSDEPEAAFATRACARVLRRHVSAEEVDEALGQLPGSIRQLLAEAGDEVSP